MWPYFANRTILSNKRHVAVVELAALFIEDLDKNEPAFLLVGHIRRICEATAAAMDAQLS